MGVAFYIRIENCPEDLDVSVDGKNLGLAIDSLNTFAQGELLKPLGDFLSHDPSELLEILSEGDREILEERGIKSVLPPEQWFAPADGLKTIRRLIQWIDTMPSQIKKPGEVLHDLKRFEAILSEAEQRGLRWHLAMDI